MACAVDDLLSGQPAGEWGEGDATVHDGYVDVGPGWRRAEHWMTIQRQELPHYVSACMIWILF